MKTTSAKTRLLLAAVLCSAAYGATAFGQAPDSTCPPSKPNVRRYKAVKTMPKLGERISGYPKWKREMIMASGGDSRKSYEVSYGGINYTVGTHRTSEVIKWISTHDFAFRTPEGLAAGDTVDKVRAVAETEVGAEPGWAFHARLPSGWSAAFVQGRYMTEGELSPTAKICFFFKREP